MGTIGRKVVGAVATVAVAAAVNVATALFTENRTAGWIAFGVALVVFGVGVQIWLTVTADRAPRAEMRVADNRIGGGVEMNSDRSLPQTVSGSDIAGNVTMRQGGS